MYRKKAGALGVLDSEVTVQNATDAGTAAKTEDAADKVLPEGNEDAAKEEKAAELPNNAETENAPASADTTAKSSRSHKTSDKKAEAAAPEAPAAPADVLPNMDLAGIPEDALAGLPEVADELPVIQTPAEIEQPQPPTRAEMLAFVKANYDAKNQKAILTFYKVKALEALADADLAVVYNRKRASMGYGV